jgi:hypothetical protein
MTSKIKVDNIENQCGGAVVTKCGATTTISGSVVKADDIQAADGGNLINQCGTTITLGASGDTINLASGASQTGFGRTGTVDWDTTAKTASFTAVSGNGYFVNTTSGAVTMTLPASPSAGDIVSVADYANTFATNNLTVANNSSPINGISDNYTADSAGISLTFVYVDGTRGWKNINDGTTNATGLSDFIIASGGTETTCGDYKIHTFTSPGTFTVSQAGTACGSNTIDYLVVAGGGGTGDASSGGGGAGGFRSNYPSCCSGVSITAQGYPVTVGGGGSGGPNAGGTKGSDSIFSTITSTGGGQGNGGATPVAGSSGGSGGGAGGGGTGNSSGGSGNTPPVSPPQGNNAGSNTAQAGVGAASGGGGGASSAGSNGVSSPTYDSGSGGNGSGTGINPSPSVGTPGPSAPLRYFAGGGGGSEYSFGLGGAPGGYGGGGDGGGSGNDGTTNSGGGAGGNAVSQGGSNGGSGIVIIRYKFQ